LALLGWSHLAHHRLRFGDAARLQRLVDLVQRGVLRLRRGGTGTGERQDGQACQKE
jgi:hypothetical protein